MATLEKASKVFVCCGQYFAATKECINSKIICPRCGQRLSVTVKTPTIQIIKK